MNIKDTLGLGVAVVICEAAGIIGSVFTMSAIPTWYATIVKPALNPPSWVFGPTWATLYLLMGIAAWLVWKKRGENGPAVKTALAIFGLQLFLNALWSILFFGLHSPALALIDIALMWGAIVWTIIVFSKLSRIAAYLLLPYLLWVSFASYLNYSIWMLN